MMPALAHKDEERLATLVRDYPELYDNNNSFYNNQTRKDKCWLEIGENMNLAPEVVKTCWYKLRDAYRKAMKLRRAKIEEEGVSKLRPWKLEHQMKFLLPHMGAGADKISTSASAVPGGHHLASDLEVDDALIPNFGLIERDSDVDNDGFSVTDIVNGTLGNYCQVDYPPEERRRKIPRARRNMPDTLISFFSCMADTVRTFPSLGQLDAKKEVFDIVQRYERKYLKIKSAAAATSTIAGSSPSSPAGTESGQRDVEEDYQN